MEPRMEANKRFFGSAGLESRLFRVHLVCVNMTWILSAVSI